jgi:hypothetical protein
MFRLFSICLKKPFLEKSRLQIAVSRSMMSFIFCRIHTLFFVRTGRAAKMKLTLYTLRDLDLWLLVQWIVSDSCRNVQNLRSRGMSSLAGSEPVIGQDAFIKFQDQFS